MVSKEEFQGWILDYACYHRIFPIINAISLRHGGRLDDLPVPHLRLSCATTHFIIENEQLPQFDVAIKLVQQVNQALPPLLVCQKTYLRLLTGLKIKALFHQLEQDTDRALVKLNTYFPRSTLKPTNMNQGQKLSKFNQNHKNFRCFFFSLVSNENQLHAYLKEDYNAEFGPEFMESLKKLCGRFLQKIESQLLPPMIEKVLACTECEKFPEISPATEMLLDFVHEKKLSSQSDSTSQQHPTGKKGRSRASFVFTEQELFEMLTVSYPLYTQDWLARDHGLNLSSQDLFDSFDSQENVPYSQMNSPRMIISKSLESASASLMPLAGSQDQEPLQQGSSENPAPECIRQTLRRRQEARHSSRTSEEACQEPQPECAEPQSAMARGEVRQSQLVPVENRLQSPTIREEDEPSKMGTGVLEPPERIEEEMEHSEAQPEAGDQSPMIQDDVRSSKRGPRTRHQLQKRQNAVRHSQRGLETGHQAETIQDEIPASEIELEKLCLSQIAAQDKVPSQSFTRQEMVQENVLLQSVKSERTLSPLPKRPEDQQQPTGLPQQEELHPQQEELQPQQETCPPTLLQTMDVDQLSDSSSAVFVSPPCTEKTVPANLTSTPIHPQREPSPNIVQQEEDHDSQRQTHLDPLLQEFLIRPWPGYVPRQPSHKLLRSNAFGNCNSDSRKDAKMVRTRKRPPDASAATLEKNSPKHSSAVGETSALSCRQSDKECETLPSSCTTSSSLRLSTDISSIRLSTDISSISSGSCDIVSPSDTNSAEMFFLGTPEETIDSDYNFITRHLIQDVKACIIKLYRNQQLDVMDDGRSYRIYR